MSRNGTKYIVWENLTPNIGKRLRPQRFKRNEVVSAKTNIRKVGTPRSITFSKSLPTLGSPAPCLVIFHSYAKVMFHEHLWVLNVLDLLKSIDTLPYTPSRKKAGVPWHCFPSAPSVYPFLQEHLCELLVTVHS